MPDSRITTLSSGAGWPGSAPAEFRNLSADNDAPPEFRHLTRAVVKNPRRRSGPASSHVTVLAAHVAAGCENTAELNQAGLAYERLSCMALARKNADPSPIGPGERRAMLRASGLPGPLYANLATESIFSSSAERLGKGGVLGTISKAVSQTTINKVVKAATFDFGPLGIVDYGKKLITGGINVVVTEATELADLEKKAAPAVAAVAPLAQQLLNSGLMNGVGSYTPEQAVQAVASQSLPGTFWNTYGAYILAGGGALALFALIQGGGRRR